PPINRYFPARVLRRGTREQPLSMTEFVFVVRTSEGYVMSQVTHQNATAGHPGDDMAKTLADAEALCRAVAGRDLDGIPLYLVPQSILPPECGSGDHCYAYTLGSLDLYYF